MLEQKSNPENIEVIETRSISEEAFINLGDESNHENVCPDDVLFRVLKAIANEKETEIIDQIGEDSETYDLGTPQVKECFLIEKPDLSFLDIQKCKEEPLDPWEEQSFQEILNSGLDSQISSTEFDSEKEYEQRGVKKFSCNECGKCFAYKKIFKSHVDGAHKKPSLKMPKMAKNGQMFTSFADEKNPKPKENKNFGCDKCKSVFEDKVQLKVHLKKVLLNEKPFQCGLCKRQFSLSVKLQKHVIKFHPSQYGQSQAE